MLNFCERKDINVNVCVHVYRLFLEGMYLKINIPILMAALAFPAVMTEENEG